MSIEMVFYMSMALFLLSLLGLFASSHPVTVFVSLQLTAAAAVVNLLNFSLRIAPQEPAVKMLLILGLLTFYLLEFSAVFYIYSNRKNLAEEQFFKGFRLISLEKTDWWGEDRV
jgi:NADH:ubiquinone oxidoreductase subunit K